MSEDKGKISRRNFFKGAAMGVLGGTALGMGLVFIFALAQILFSRSKTQTGGHRRLQVDKSDEHFGDELV